jgi:Holliday junction resolvase RusA-like endonuclease
MPRWNIEPPPVRNCEACGKELISFFVQGEPIGKGSTKSYPYKKPDGGIGVSTTNASKKTASWENRIADVASQAVSATGFYEDGDIGYEVYMRFYRSRPKSMPKRKTMWLVKFDLDKLERCVLDALTEVAFPDDSMVVRIDSEKAHCPDNHLPEHAGQPGVMVVVKKRREFAP